MVPGKVNAEGAVNCPFLPMRSCKFVQSVRKILTEVSILQLLICVKNPR